MIVFRLRMCVCMQGEISDVGQTNLGFDYELSEAAAGVNAVSLQPDGVTFTIGDSPLVERRGCDAAVDETAHKKQVSVVFVLIECS